VRVDFTQVWLDLCEAYAHGDHAGVLELARRNMNAWMCDRMYLELLRANPEIPPGRILHLALDEGEGAGS
jgi:hypothetical protein